MTPVLIVHIVAGVAAIASGTMAVAARKGGRAHRLAGTVFVLAMTTMAALAIYLALFVPPVGAAGAPPAASAAVATLTLYLVATAWMTVRRKAGQIGLFERSACVVAVIIAAALAILGLRAAASHEALVAPYFVFAAFAAFVAALDLNVILRGGISGVARLSRHLWRMCFALFFACAFFFIGQQKVMPKSLHGSPVLFALGLAPLGVLLFWMIRVRFTKLRGPGAPDGAQQAI